MATYHVCDICGDDMPKDETRQCFVQVGAKKKFRETTPDVNIECCPQCAKRIASTISAMQSRNAEAERGMNRWH